MKSSNKLISISVVILLLIGTLTGCNNKELKSRKISGIKIGDSMKKVEKSTDNEILSLYPIAPEHGELVVIDYDGDSGFKVRSSISVYKDQVYGIFHNYSDNENRPTRQEIIERFKDSGDIDMELDGKIIRLESSDTKSYFTIGENDDDVPSMTGISYYGLDRDYENLFREASSDEAKEEMEILLKEELKRIGKSLEKDKINQFDEFSKRALENPSTIVLW